MRTRLLAAASALAVLLAGTAAPQTRRALTEAERQPVTFTAGEVEYDETRDLVIARGGVEAWQGERILRAREITFHRPTGRATARGEVVLMEPDGRVFFAEEAELTDDMREGVIRELRALLAEGGRLAAAGAVRSGGRVTEMARAVYSTCEPCRDDPQRAPLWQIRADRVIHDEQEKVVEYFDATMQIAGIPVLYVPYFWHADPSVKRKSGFLFPEFGTSSFLGAFWRQPYYWVISPSEDATIAPMLSARKGGVLFGEWRRRFNAGFATASGSVTYDPDETRWRGHVTSRGRFSIDETWRAGWDAARASDRTYLRRYRLGALDASSVLVTTPFLEGFGRSFYARADANLYQGLGSLDSARRIPVVLPRLYGAFFGVEDRFGGQWEGDLGVFATTRAAGTDTRRIASRLGWTLPFRGPIGDLWTVAGNVDLLGYQVGGDPAATPVPGGETGAYGRAHPQVALTWRWPLLRTGAAWGSQLIEPIVQVVAGPNTGADRRIPNEDSVDLEFTDASLFGFNRFPGRDRLDGGYRLNAGLRGAWFLDGVTVEGLFGQAFRAAADDLYPAGSGLEGRRSDYVARLTVIPSEHLTLSYRTRLDREDFSTRLADFSATVSAAGRSLTVSYLAAPAAPAALQPQARREIGATLSGRLWGNWSGFVGARRDLREEAMVSSYAGLRYEDECFAFLATYLRRFTSVEGASAGTDLIFTLVFKTVGEVGFSAL
ncbi:LPS-assembly protein LptD [Elioraea sp. Yellowstone]|jgi:LPS-assembly protein|uniref:LPS-assembly protein LptD n=1 Tax=Elioraea sp. Yellowstone TaxID=2592070 RepID=UPI0011512BF2|nr:LPS assembly protein LptD [Elioraea sp. Yellowstone]TQF76877.1 LPS-assembly protein LptD [Elioraea sp. Yellowstone]